MKSNYCFPKWIHLILLARYILGFNSVGPFPVWQLVKQVHLQKGVVRMELSVCWEVEHELGPVHGAAVALKVDAKHLLVVERPAPVEVRFLGD